MTNCKFMQFIIFRFFFANTSVCTALTGLLTRFCCRTISYFVVENLVALKCRVPVNSKWLCFPETSMPTSNITSCLSCIDADHSVICLNEFSNVHLHFMFELSLSRYIMSIIVCSCQHCDEQQFHTLSYVHYIIFSVVKLDLFTRSLLLDHNLV